MGVDKNIQLPVKHSKTVDIYRPPALRYEEASSSSILKGDSKYQSNNSDNHAKEIKVQSNSNQILRRERRPDRAVYIPRAKRSQTASPPTHSLKSNANEMISANNKNENSKNPLAQISENVSRRLNEYGSATCLCDKGLATKSDKLCVVANVEKVVNNKSTKSCDQFAQNNADSLSKTFEKSNSCLNPSNSEIMNTKNENNMKSSTKKNEIPLIESGEFTKNEIEDDKEIIELERMSKEINRSSRRIIKQTFKSNVLVIPDVISTISQQTEGKFKDIDPENDDWESMFDDNGECLDPKIISELTASVGKVTIEEPASDYKAFLLKQEILNDEEYPHVLEVSNFPVEFKTQDLMMVFSAYKESGFDIKWVDDTHALAVFSSSRIAAEVLAMGHPFAVLKPLADATLESRSKARKCAASLQPYRTRPETCAALARRLVTGALGVRLKTAAEERENEKRILRVAKEKKLLAAKQRDEAWES